MRIAHVRERHAPAGAPWRLAAALDGEQALHWLDLEVARRRAWRRMPNRAHNSACFTAADDDARRAPRTRSAGRRAGRAGRRLPAARRSRRRRRRAGGGRPRLRAAGPAAADVPRLLRLRAARRDDVGPPRRRDPRGVVSGCRSSTSRTSPRCAARASPCGRRAAARSSTSSSRSGRSSTRPVLDLTAERAEEAIGGYFVAQRLVGAGPPARRDDGPAGPGEGQGLRDDHRAVDRDAGRARRSARAAGATAPDLAMTAVVRARRRHGSRRRGVARLVVERALLVRRRCSRAPRPTSASGRATCSAAARSARAASSRSRTRRWGAGSSRARGHAGDRTRSARSRRRSSRVPSGLMTTQQPRLAAKAEDA